MKINARGNFIVRGQTSENGGPKKVSLFDGTYKSGFRVVRFEVAGEGPQFDDDATGKVTTDTVTTAADTWDWGDQREVAWSSSNHFSQSVRESFNSIVDDAIVLVEEMYVYVHSTRGTGELVNFLIELQPVDLKDWEYSLSYVQGKSQG